jgi:xanthine dehydrogenase accessory factor
MSIYLKLREINPGAGNLALATIIEASGSTPQKAGISAIFSSNGLEAGTIGGGVLEGRTGQLAMEAALTGKSSIHRFELDKDIHHADEAICGGRATVLIDATILYHAAIFKEASEMLSRKIPCILATVVNISQEKVPEISRMLIKDTEAEDYQGPAKDSVIAVSARLLDQHGDENFIKIDAGNNFIILLEALFPSHKLIIAGAGHIGKALAHLGKMVGFEVTVIDDREEFANKKNIPEADQIIVDDIGKAMSSLPLNDTFIVIVTRGHNDDSLALRQCIKSGAAYIGMIGSRGKVEKMHRNFIENAWATEEEWNAIHAPVGIDIKSQTVEEIAVSIAAQLILVRNQKKVLT